MKKIMSIILAVALLFTMSIEGFAADLTTSTPTGEMTITTVVPEEHQITITYNEGGYVLFNGVVVESGSTVTVPRFGNLYLDVIGKSDSHLKSVVVNGEDKLSQMQHGQLILEHVNTDIQIEFGFQKCSDAGEDDACHHLSMHGNVYRGDKHFANAELQFDLGEMKATADKNGAYSLAKIKDGRHTVSIADADGTLAGKTDFVIAKDENATEMTVTKLSDGTQLITVPKSAEDVKVDFIVNEDGSITIVPTPKEEPPIINNPIISQTGKLIREYPGAFGTVFVGASLFILLLLLLKKKKEDDEKENTTA